MLSKLSISQKIGLGFALMVAIIGILIGISFQAFKNGEEASQWNIHTYQLLQRLDAAQRDLINMETGMRGFLITGNEDFLQPLKLGGRQFQEDTQAIAQMAADNPQQQQRLTELKNLQDHWYRDDLQPSLQLRRQQPAGAAASAELTQRIDAAHDKIAMDQMRSLLAQMAGNEQQLLNTRTAALASANQAVLMKLLGGGAIAAVLALLIALYLSRNTQSRLQMAIDAANAVADGRLDTDIDVSSNDELPRAFDRMQRSLRDMVQQISQAARQLVESIEQITNASQQLATASTDQSNSASSMAATIEELSVSISHVSESAQEAHRLANQSGQQSNEGSAVIQATLDSLSSIASTVQKSSEQVGELGEHSDQISSIIGVIQSIADQTNLLALNAAIEAARAGEQGRGFAVVADEVRLLAQHTGKSTQEISTMIVKMQSGIHDTVDNMKVGVEVVDQGVTQGAQAGAAIVAIRDGSAKVVQVVDQISFALREQNAASQDVARNVEQMAQMAERNRGEVQNILETNRTLTELSRGLERQVARFSL